MKNSSLKVQLLVNLLFFIILAMGTLFYLSYSGLKEEVHKSQSSLYLEKVDNIIYLIDQKYQKLQKTQMVDSYEDAFKKGTISMIKNVFHVNKEASPFIVNEKQKFVLHKEFNNKNDILYKNSESFKKLIELKTGDLHLDNERWLVFKYYEPWNWIIGYELEEEYKFTELNKFKNNFIISTVLILLLSSIIIMFIVKLVLKPISDLTNVSKEISSGNLSAKIDVNGALELRDLSKNFEIMRDKIVDDIDTLKAHENKINNFNEELKEEVENRTQELLEQKNAFETLFYDTSDGISLLKDGIFTDCNDFLLKMLNLENKEEFLNKSPLDFSPEFQPGGEKSETKAMALINQSIEEGNVRFEWLISKPDGRGFWAEIVLTSIVLNNEIILHAVWRDIQDKKMLELELQNKNNDLIDSNDELEAMLENLTKTQNKLVESEKLAGLGNLVAGVAHEITTPLGLSLTGSSHLAYMIEDINEKYKEQEMSEEEFKLFLENSLSLVNIVNTNLDRSVDIVKSFKQVAVDQTSEQKRVFKIKDYFRGVLVSIDNITKKRDVEFNIICDDELEITSYPGFFAQILTNLAANSIYHAYDENDKGKVEIEVIRTKDGLDIRYEDDGKGISQNNMSKIFEPFFTTNKEGGGSGLGLNIIYNLVTTNLKGTIECDSKVNVGTSFKISIPL